MNKTTEGLLKTAPVDWEDRVNRILTRDAGIEYLPPVKDRSELTEVISDLDAHIQGAVRLLGYVEQRYGNGCGDQGHADAVKESNRLVTKVRRALGFTHPDRGAISF